MAVILSPPLSLYLSSTFFLSRSSSHGSQRHLQPAKLNKVLKEMKLILSPPRETKDKKCFA